MFLIALCKLAPNWKQSPCPSAGDWLNRFGCVQTTERDEKEHTQQSNIMEEHHKS